MWSWGDSNPTMNQGHYARSSHMTYHTYIEYTGDIPRNYYTASHYLRRLPK